MPSDALLEVTDVATWFDTDRGMVHAVDGVSFALERGRTLGIVGESGSGKTVLSRSIMGLLPKKGVVRQGSIRFDGEEIGSASPKEMRKYWGASMAMVFQDPMTALNPVMKIGKQITESITTHLDVTRSFARELAVSLLESVRVPDPERRMDEYPHQLSGGLRQRVCIAVALACGPQLLLADEPTTALDVTVQAQVLDVLEAQQRERFMALAARHPRPRRRRGPRRRGAGDVRGSGGREGVDGHAVLRHEDALHRGAAALDPQDRRAEPHAPHRHSRAAARPRRPAEGMPVRGTLRVRAGSLPRGAAAVAARRRPRSRVPVLVPGGHARGRRGPGPQPGRGRRHTDGSHLVAGTGTAHLRPENDVLLRVEDLVVEFRAEGGKVKAVSGISLDLVAGETLGLVGESGCGKSTTGRAVMQLPRPTSGTVRFDGVELTALKGNALRETRPQLQMIFQDPISSLNPRRKVGDIVAEGLEIWNIGDAASRTAKVDEVLGAVGLDPDTARDRRPHEFSGGQCQRISIARAVITDPKLIICDEPVSALDVSVQAQILNLLEEMKERYNLTMLFIAHDLAVVKNVSDRVAVMYLGKLCEVGAPDVLYAQPAHPYTAALLASIPVPDPGSPPDDTQVLSGEIPSNLNPPSGCRFRTRCPRAQERCAEEEPQIRNVGPDQYVACHFPLTPGEAIEFR